MINLQLSVREAMNLATNCNLEIYERIVTAFEVALGVNQRRMVTITKGMDCNNRISCIRAVRQHTGWGLKEAKDWTDVWLVATMRADSGVVVATPSLSPLKLPRRLNSCCVT